MEYKPSMILSVAFALLTQTTVPEPNPTDVKSPEALLASLYDVISGPAGQKRDWNRFKSLFSPKGTMAALAKNREGKMVLVTMTPDDYIARSGPYLETKGFFEKETRRKLVKSGNMVNIFSDYESRNTLTDKKPIQTGTNSLQMNFDGSRWFIHSVLWQGQDVK
jgi:hypothetical protein